MKKEKIKILLITVMVLLVSSCATKKQDKKLNIKDGLVTIVLPENLLMGNTADDIVESCYTLDDETPEGAVKPSEQIEKCYVNNNGLATEVYTKSKLKYRQDLMKESALMEADFYKVSALKKVVFENDDLTRAKVYVKKSKYEGGVKDSMNQKTRALVKVSVTTYMGLYQIYSGVDPKEWKVHLTIYDVDTKEVLYEYDYPTEEFPHIII